MPDRCPCPGHLEEKLQLVLQVDIAETGSLGRSSSIRAESASLPFLPAKLAAPLELSGL